jgi:hypothetical protein
VEARTVFARDLDEKIGCLIALRGLGAICFGTMLRANVTGSPTGWAPRALSEAVFVPSLGKRMLFRNFYCCARCHGCGVLGASAVQRASHVPHRSEEVEGEDGTPPIRLELKSLLR